MMLYPIAQTLWRPTWCSIRLRKYSVGRHDALSYGNKHSDGRQNALFYWGITNLGQERSFSERFRYSVGRHDALSVCASTLSAVTMLFLVGINTLTAVTMLTQNEKALCRPSECFMMLKMEYLYFWLAFRRGMNYYEALYVWKVNVAFWIDKNYFFTKYYIKCWKIDKN